MADASEQYVLSLQAAVEATADGILVVDRTGKVTLINQRLLELWNLSEQELAGADERAILDAMLARVEDPDGFRAGVLGVQDQPEREYVDVIRLQDGRVYERHTRPQRIDDAFVGRVWSYRDISERERLLRRAVFLADATRLLVSVDVERALDAVVQLMVPDLGDGCVIDLLDDGAPRRSLAVSRDPQNPISLEVHASVLRGQPILYQVHSTSYLGVPIGVKGRIVGALTLAAARHRKYTQTDLELAEELGSRIALCIDNARLHQRAQEALRARDEILSIASHEIRGPITSLHLAVQMLRAGQIPPESHASIFELIEREGQRLSRLVDELLDVGRIRAGTLRFEFEEVDLGEIVRSVTSRLGLELARAGSALMLDIEGQVRGMWDHLRLDQIVTNLLSNAIKFGLGKPIRVSVATRDDFAILVVSDQGMGMAVDLQARVFQPFERGVPVRHYGGLGLGLYIVKTLVDGFGGHINVESTLGSGSKFTVELPRARTANANGSSNSRR
jgi:PAS domain S-box-containing protein